MARPQGLRRLPRPTAALSLRYRACWRSCRRCGLACPPMLQSWMSRSWVTRLGRRSTTQPL